MVMDEQNSYDVRGSQSRVLRLLNFDREGLIHMMFYRVAVFSAIVLAASMVIGFIDNGTPFINLTGTMLVITWILFTPQVFETSKAMSIIASRGIVFGRLNESFLKYGAPKSRLNIIYSAFPYMAIAIWAIGFACVIWLWFA